MPHFNVCILLEILISAQLLQLYRTVNVDFNSLNMIVNVQSWIVVLDFFGLSDDQPVSAQPTNYSKPVSRRQSITSMFSPMNGIETHCEYWLVLRCYISRAFFGKELNKMECVYFRIL